MRSNRKILYWLGALLVLVGVVGIGSSDLDGVGDGPGGGQAEYAGGERPAGVPAKAQEARVARVVDGDTVVVDVELPGDIPAGTGLRVRLLEIDTPETVRPGYPVECGGREASKFASDRMPSGSTLYLLADREDKDQYGRYLRYVWNHKGEFFNEQAVEQGYAKVVFYPPNDLYLSRLKRAEAGAREAGKGLWGEVCPLGQ